MIPQPWVDHDGRKCRLDDLLARALPRRLAAQARRIPVRDVHRQAVADAAIAILLQKFSAATGQFYIDEDLLRANGVTDFEQYAILPGTPLLPDFFL